ncbi:hypothetical protein D3C80_1281120 [compost metagenome]
MADHRQRVLLGAADLPGLWHALAMLAHGQPRARLAITRQLRLQMAGAQLQKRLEPFAQGSAAMGLQEDMAQPLIDGDGRIGGGIHATGNAAVDLPQGDFVGYQQCRFQPGATGLLQIVSRRLR